MSQRRIYMATKVSLQPKFNCIGFREVSCLITLPSSSGLTHFLSNVEFELPYIEHKNTRSLKPLHSVIF